MQHGTVPEGDTIHNVALLLRRHLLNEPMVAGYVGTEAKVLEPGTVTAVKAMGKHLLIALEDGRVIRSHLGMHGSWHRYAPGESWLVGRSRARIVLRTRLAELICFSPAEVALLSASQAARWELGNSRIGPDLMVLTDLSNVVERARRLARASDGVAEVLLDQRIACGLGNVYKSEVLFLQRRAPGTALGNIDDASLTDIYRLGSELLRRNLGSRRRRTRPRPGAALWVYGRAHQPCFECGENIVHARTGPYARGSWWCPSCQV
jgi:endonuclease-8